MTQTLVSVRVRAATPAFSARTARRGTSPTGPADVCPVPATPTVQSTISATAQGRVCVKQECMDPNVTTATQASSTSAARAVGHVSATTTPATATLSLVCV